MCCWEATVCEDVNKFSWLRVSSSGRFWGDSDEPFSFMTVLNV